MLKVLLSFCLMLPTIICKQPSCQSNQLVFGDSCLDQCPENTVLTTRNGINQCQECDLTNFWVLKEDRSRCVCAKQTYLDSPNNRCVPCHYTCLTCNGPSTENCETCDYKTSQTFRYKQGGQCLCPQGYYDDKTLQSIKCKKCQRDCEQCTGPSDQQCVKCGVGRIKNNFGQCICTNNFIQDANGKCYCPYTVMPDGSCKNLITQCGHNQEPEYNTALTRMISAATLNNPGVRFENQCQCRKGLFRIKGQCGSCPENQIFNPRNGKCQCVQGGQRIKGICVVCPGNQTLNRKTGQCVCKKNQQKAIDGFCVKCPSKSVYSIQQGRCVCIFNYYQDVFSGRCRKCNKKLDGLLCTQNIKGLDRVRRLDIRQLKGDILGTLKNILNPNTGNNQPNINNFSNVLTNNSFVTGISQMFSPIFGGINKR